MGATALAAFIMVDLEMVAVMGVTSISLAVFGCLFVLTTSKTPSRETNSDALVFLILFWGVIPMTAALPYWLTFPELGFLRSYFTSVSALTTTGANGYVVETLPATLILWQSLLQFFGGVCVATRVHGEERERVSGVCERVVGAPRRAWTCKSDDQRGEVIDYYLEM